MPIGNPDMKRAFLQLHTAIFLAGFTAVLGKLILLNEGILVWYRLVITVSVLGLGMIFKKNYPKQSWVNALRMGAVGAVIAFHWVTFYGSVKYGNISVALVCLSASGFFSALLEPVLLKKKIVFSELCLGLLAIAGIYIIFDFHPQFKLGIIYGILAAIGSAIFPIFNKKLLAEFSPETLSFYELAGGLIFLTALLPFYLTYEDNLRLLPTFAEFGWLLILSVICTVLCFSLQLNALKHISAFTSNLMYNLEPLYGIILAFIFFNEGSTFHREFYLGVFFILSAIVIQMMRLQKSKIAA